MLTEKLATESYYLSKLSLFMRNDPLIEQRVHMLFGPLSSVNDAWGAFAEAWRSELLPIFANEIVEKGGGKIPYAQSLSDKDGTDDKLLDILAACFGLTRSFRAASPSFDAYMALKTFYKSLYPDDETLENFGKVFPSSVTLTNNQLRAVLYARIMRNNYDGTRSFLMGVNGAGLPGVFDVLSSQFGIEIVQYDSQAAPARCRLYFGLKTWDGSANAWADYDYKDPTTNQYMAAFVDGFFTIKSVGVEYSYHLTATDDTEAGIYVGVGTLPYMTNKFVFVSYSEKGDTPLDDGEVLARYV